MNNKRKMKKKKRGLWDGLALWMNIHKEDHMMGLVFKLASFS
jgi:hypothetical protein